MTVPMQQTFRFNEASRDLRPSRANIVIEAGAGTGKTSAIVAEVLKLLLENEEQAPERIVLMTFTEKAAGEIADRIHQALAELELQFDNERVIWPVDSANPLFEVPPGRKEAYRAACRRQIERIDGIRSQTIHSFCQSLLRAHPIEAALDPQFKIVEGFERSLLYGELYDAWLDDETRLHPAEEKVREWEFLLAHVGYLFQIRDLVFSLLARRDLLSEPGHDFGSFEDIEGELRDALTAIRRSDISKIGDAAARTVFRYVQSVEPPATGATLDDWIIYFEPISEAIVNANLAGDRDLKEALVTLRTSRAKSDTCIYHRLVRHRSAVAIHSLTRRFIDFLDREKRLLGVVDFDDLLLRTVTLLDDAAVLESVRAQFDYIFVDEFQDTDRTQARIIERLARDRTGAWVPGRTIIVGDPKQSIYGFRRADPEMYRAMSDKMIQAGAEHRIIRDQYRSDPPLLDVINVMFEAVFTIGGASNANVFRPAYHELKAGKRECDRELDARFTLLHAEHEPEAIAEWIMRNRDGSERDLQRFAILFRRLTRIDEYLDVFDRYGISYVLPPTKAFLERRAPVDLMAVLRAIAFPFDRGAEISAARTPYFALTDDEIAEGVVVEDQIAADGLKPVATPNAAIGTTPGVATPIEAIDTKTGVGTGFSPSSSPSWRAFRDTLATYREQSRHLTVSGTIDLLVNTANIEDIYAQTADGHRAARHLERVRTLAFEYDQKIGGSIRQFVEEIDRRRDEPDDVEPSLADDDSNAVRIMSVHAAKGLEFETVILPDLAFRTRGGGEGLQLYSVEDPPSLVMTGRAQSLSAHYRFASDGSTRLKKILGDRDEAEVRRLFYVAVTRARTDVVFVCNSVFRNDGFLRCLGETFGFAKDSFASMWGPGRELRELRVNGRAIRVAFDNQSAGEGAGAPLAVARLRDPALETRLAAGAIEALAIATPAAAETFERPDAAIARSRSRGRAGGLLLHRFLEQWDGAGDGDDLLQMLAHEAASAEETVAAVRRRIRTIRDSAVMKRILAAETIGREMAIRIAEDGELLERRIDRLIREDGRDVIVDYKSGRPDAARVERDRAQVQQYCRAITAMTGRDCSAMLWYIDLESDVLIET